ncbi:hypothetical protein BpHYR1_045256, partial [Brachionus plicatilis]
GYGSKLSVSVDDFNKNQNLEHNDFTIISNNQSKCPSKNFDGSGNTEIGHLKSENEYLNNLIKPDDLKKSHLFSFLLEDSDFLDERKSDYNKNINDNKKEFVNENNENHYDDLITKIQQLENEQKILKERFDEKTLPHGDTKETRPLCTRTSEKTKVGEFVSSRSRCGRNVYLGPQGGFFLENPSGSLYYIRGKERLQINF